MLLKTFLLQHFIQRLALSRVLVLYGWLDLRIVHVHAIQLPCASLV
jgi:hypothetical protein